MSASTRHIVHDGLDIRKEYARLCQLKTWHWKLRANPPRLDLTVFQKRTRRLGSAWYSMGRIKVNLHRSQSRYDVMEVLIHELAHFEMAYRFPGKSMGHAPEFWTALDAAFAEAYPGAEDFLMPRTNIFHGRYSKALRFHLESPAEEEKRIIKWLNGAQVQVVGFDEPVAATEIEVHEVKKLTTGELDERVLALISSTSGSTRAHVEAQYPVVYGEPYPGKSPYNSMWRLAKAGLIERHGRVWVRKKDDS